MGNGWSPAVEHDLTPNIVNSFVEWFLCCVFFHMLLLDKVIDDTSSVLSTNREPGNGSPHHARRHKRHQHDMSHSNEQRSVLSSATYDSIPNLTV